MTNKLGLASYHTYCSYLIICYKIFPQPRHHLKWKFKEIYLLLRVWCISDPQDVEAILELLYFHDVSEPYISYILKTLQITHLIHTPLYQIPLQFWILFFKLSESLNSICCIWNVHFILSFIKYYNYSNKEQYNVMNN